MLLSLLFFLFNTIQDMVYSPQYKQNKFFLPKTLGKLLPQHNLLLWKAYVSFDSNVCLQKVSEQGCDVTKLKCAHNFTGP